MIPISGFGSDVTSDCSQDYHPWFSVSGLRFTVCSGREAQVVELRVRASGVRVQSFGLGFQGLRFGIQSSGLRVQGRAQVVFYYCF